MKNKIIKNMEWVILVCAIILLIIGMLALFSATKEDNSGELTRQMIWTAISIPIMIIVMWIDYEEIVKVAPLFYGVFIILFILVLFTEPINGARSWFRISESLSFQPSELAKVFVIMTMAVVLVKLQKSGRREINKIWKLLLFFMVIGVPLGLIVIQPDIGTAASYVVSMLFMLFVSGIDKKYIIVAILLIAIAIPLSYIYILPEHAKARIDVFLNPELDPRGIGYNIIQSKLAIGAGQLFGMGILKGNQTQLGFLYPKTTDFIFAVIGEEFGFILTSTIVILYVVLLTKGVYIAKTAKDDLGSYISIGIVGLFFFHMLENIGMTIGLLPITGVPLPFVSYGGSSLVTNFICIGLLLNISGRRKKAIFVN